MPVLIPVINLYEGHRDPRFNKRYQQLTVQENKYGQFSSNITSLEVGMTKTRRFDSFYTNLHDYKRLNKRKDHQDS